MTNETVWDKTNIGENYPGITLPLTYSFIGHAYCKVYPNFLKILGVSKQELHDKNQTFENLLGYINGQVYYNIENWYSLLKFIPGYKKNKEYFETMLDPVEKKPATENMEQVTVPEILRNTKIYYNFLKNILFIGEHYRNFDIEYDKCVSYFEALELDKLSNQNLVQEYKILENNLFSAWAYTIVNDFRVMMLFGMYTGFIKNTLKINDNSIATYAYGLNSKPESVILLNKLIGVSEKVKQRGIVLDTLENLKIQDTDIYDSVMNYLEKYGERSFNELKLESTNFKESPQHFISLINYYASLSFDELARYKKDSQHKVTIESEEIKKLNFINRIFYKFLYDKVTRSIFKREEFRLKRAKVFWIANQFFKEIGTRFIDSGIIQNVGDIYYLYKEELLDTLVNHRLNENLSSIINNRKIPTDGYASEILPRRIKTTRIFDVAKETKKSVISDVIRVRVTSKGKINKGVVTLMNTLSFNKDIKGKVLVTHATDPGWTILFPLIAGIIIEEGGMLSHASIVARELGIPCVVLPNALTLLNDGDIINLDTDTAQIKLESDENN